MIDVDYLTASSNSLAQQKRLFLKTKAKTFLFGCEGRPRKCPSTNPHTGDSKQGSVPWGPVLMLQLKSNPAPSCLCVLLSNPFCLELRIPVPAGFKSAEFTIHVLFDIQPVAGPVFLRISGCFYSLQWSPPRTQANLLSSTWMPDRERDRCKIIASPTESITRQSACRGGFERKKKGELKRNLWGFVEVKELSWALSLTLVMSSCMICFCLFNAPVCGSLKCNPWNPETNLQSDSKKNAIHPSCPGGRCLPHYF